MRIEATIRDQPKVIAHPHTHPQLQANKAAAEMTVSTHSYWLLPYFTQTHRSQMLLNQLSISKNEKTSRKDSADLMVKNTDLQQNR